MKKNIVISIMVVMIIALSIAVFIPKSESKDIINLNNVTSWTVKNNTLELVVNDDLYILN